MAGGGGSPCLYQNVDFFQQQIFVVPQKNRVRLKSEW